MTYKILCAGPLWRGSNANGLFYALGRLGHVIKIIDDRYYFNFEHNSNKGRLIERIFRNYNISSYNKSILNNIEQLKPDIFLVFKGAFVLPETVVHIKKSGIFTANFYPDVSFTAHTSILPETLKQYDLIFTTKTFGIEDMKTTLGVERVHFVPHGFDPNVHREFNVKELKSNPQSSDVSFIGGYSQKKSDILLHLKNRLDWIDLKIYGEKWDRNPYGHLQSSIQGFGITNDFYTLAIQASKINLGLLHEQVSGASSGDKITSRTFHIPGSGGFMIHERTDEIHNYFEEDREIVCFETHEELSDKTSFYLKNEQAREKIRIEGHARAWKDHKLDNRAERVLEIMSNHLS